MAFDSPDVDRKVVSILRVLSSAQEPLGSRIISRRLANYGIELGERAVRYHLKLMDERGLTQLVGQHDGRILTEQGLNEARFALVKDKVGLAISKIEMLAFRTHFNPRERSGLIPVNVSFFSKDKFQKALNVMRPAFEQGICVSHLVGIADEGKSLGELVVPKGQVGFATVCSIIMNGCLLKAGVPMDSRFAGILEIRDYKPLRFVELIHYSGCSLDPSAVFIKARMTAVQTAAKGGQGRILANFREVPSICRPIVDRVFGELKEAGIDGLMLMGGVSQPVCEIPLDLNRVGMILLGGLNPVAAAEEAGLAAENHPMSTVMEYSELVRFQDVD